MWYFVKVSDGMAKPTRLRTYVEADSPDEAVQRACDNADGWFDAESADDRNVIEINEVENETFEALSELTEKDLRLRYGGMQVLPKEN